MSVAAEYTGYGGMSQTMLRGVNFLARCISDKHFIPPLLFHTVECLIGLSQNSINVVARLAEVPAHANGYRRAGANTVPFNGFAYPRGNLAQRIFIAGREDHHEFVAAPAAGVVVGPHAGLEHSATRQRISSPA